MSKRFTLLTLLFLFTTLAAFAQLPRNGFEGDASDTWNNTASPAIASGTYFVKITSEKGMTARRLIVE